MAAVRRFKAGDGLTRVADANCRGRDLESPYEADFFPFRAGRPFSFDSVSRRTTTPRPISSENGVKLPFPHNAG